MLVCVHAHIQTCTHMCGGQRPTSDYSSDVIYLVFDIGSLFGLELTYYIVLAGQPLSLYSPKLSQYSGITSSSRWPSPNFQIGSGERIGVPMLAIESTLPIDLFSHPLLCLIALYPNMKIFTGKLTSLKLAIGIN